MQIDFTKKSAFFPAGELQNAQCVLFYIKSTERIMVLSGVFPPVRHRVPSHHHKQELKNG